MENSEIVKESKSILKGNYGKVILPYLIVFLISNFLSNNDLYDYNNLYKSGPKKGKPKPKKILQGNRIEHPDYIKEQSLKLDFEFYISNQIMNPVKQVLDLEKDEKETKLFFNQYIE